MKDLVSDANFECSDNEIAVQAMDSSHVSLITLCLRKEGFSHYRCDQTITMGLKMSSVAKILKCADGGDLISLKAEDEGDSLSLEFENESGDRISNFEVKLIELDAEHLDIPEEESEAVVSLSAGEFQRLCRDLGTLGDSCSISVTKEGIRFSVDGDIGKGSVTLRQGESVDEKGGVSIELREAIEQKFALRYLIMFTKATALSDRVKLTLTSEMPLKVEYTIEGLGSLCFYLAPKMDGDN